jgi:hypothetical protein
MNKWLAGTPIAMETDGDGRMRHRAQQLDDGRRDRLAVEEIDLGFVVSELHGKSAAMPSGFSRVDNLRRGRQRQEQNPWSRHEGDKTVMSIEGDRCVVLGVDQ